MICITGFLRTSFLYDCLRIGPNNDAPGIVSSRPLCSPQHTLASSLERVEHVLHTIMLLSLSTCLPSRGCSLPAPPQVLHMRGTWHSVTNSSPQQKHVTSQAPEQAQQSSWRLRALGMSTSRGRPHASCSQALSSTSSSLTHPHAPSTMAPRASFGSMNGVCDSDLIARSVAH